DAQSPGLGADFLRAVGAALAIIQRNLFQYQIVNDEVRRAALRRFPYGLITVCRIERSSWRPAFTVGAIPRAGKTACNPLDFTNWHDGISRHHPRLEGTNARPARAALAQ